VVFAAIAAAAVTSTARSQIVEPEAEAPDDLATSSPASQHPVN
jgi:hypothetical protein